MFRSIELRPLQDLAREEQSKILTIRNQPNVRKNMYTDHIISEDEHWAWVERQPADAKFFAVYSDDVLIGGASLNNINRPNRRADWAFYLDEAKQGRGLGAALESKFLGHVFIEEHLDKLNCEVLAFNEPVIRLHKKFGFVEEGVRRNHVWRSNQSVDAVLLGITRDEWARRRIEMRRLSDRHSHLDPAECGDVFAPIPQ